MLVINKKRKRISYVIFVGKLLNFSDCILIILIIMSMLQRVCDVKLVVFNLLIYNYEKNDVLLRIMLILIEMMKKYRYYLFYSICMFFI